MAARPAPRRVYVPSAAGAVQLKSKLVLPLDIAVAEVWVISVPLTRVLLPAERLPPVADTSRPVRVCVADVLDTTKSMLTTSPGSTVAVPEKEALTVAAMLDAGNAVYYRPKDKAKLADAAREGFARGSGSDHGALLAVFTTPRLSTSPPFTLARAQRPGVRVTLPSDAGTICESAQPSPDAAYTVIARRPELVSQLTVPPAWVSVGGGSDTSATAFTAGGRAGEG